MFYEAGLALYKQDKLDEAINEFKKSLKNPEEERIGACYYLAQCYSRTDRALFEKYLLQAMRYGEPSPEVCCELGIFYMEKGQYEQAIPLFSYACMKGKKKHRTFFIKDYWDFVPYLELSVCYDHLHEIETAYHFHKLAACIYPNAPSIRYNEEYYKSLTWEGYKSTMEEKKVAVLKRREAYEKVEMPGASIITVTNKKKYLDTIYENYNRVQYKKKELILVLNSKELDVTEVKASYHGDPTVRIIPLEEDITLGECLNYGISKSKYEYIVKMDDDDYYGANYVLDSIIEAMEFGADLITKTRYLIDFEGTGEVGQFMGIQEYKKISVGTGATIVAKREVFEQCKFPDLNLGEDSEFYKRCEEQGITMYSGDKFNYIYKRHKSLDDHTWGAGEQYLRDFSILIQCDVKTEEFISI